MWIRFKSTKQFAIKIYVGGVNAVSGEPAAENFATKLRRQTLKSQRASLQDYIVTPQQLWVDGIAVSPGKVRQFVAAPKGKGFSIEAQITNAETVGGIQFEVTRRKYQLNRVLQIKSRQQNLSIMVDPEMTVRELKKHVEERTKMSVDMQRYFVDGGGIDDCKHPGKWRDRR